jgi:hypothetical protein
MDFQWIFRSDSDRNCSESGTLGSKVIFWAATFLFFWAAKLLFWQQKWAAEIIFLGSKNYFFEQQIF